MRNKFWQLPFLLLESKGFLIEEKWDSSIPRVLAMVLRMQSRIFRSRHWTVDEWIMEQVNWRNNVLTRGVSDFVDNEPALSSEEISFSHSAFIYFWVPTVARTNSFPDRSILGVQRIISSFHSLGRDLDPQNLFQAGAGGNRRRIYRTWFPGVQSYFPSLLNLGL